MIIDPSLVPSLVKLELYEVPRRMIDAVIRQDVEQYLDCFTDDGIWDPSPLTDRAVGKVEIGRRFTDACATLDWAFQGHFSTVVTEYSENRAQLRSYLYEVGILKGAQSASPIGLGCYTDDLVLVDGRWKVTLHDLSVIYFGSADYTEPMFEPTFQR